MKHLTFEQRQVILEGIRNHKTDAAIAREIGVHRSTVGREIKRNGGRKYYCADLAYRIARHHQRFAYFFFRCPEGKGSLYGKNWGLYLNGFVFTGWGGWQPYRFFIGYSYNTKLPEVAEEKILVTVTKEVFIVAVILSENNIAIQKGDYFLCNKWVGNVRQKIPDFGNVA
ncbi:helix-turn-helix domain-containing protein [Limibacter armeniacum]|uniref:helix-turn-helix domain-containing protein n=1 Tax=Limibacter armeniacum TaxID=466084 RepID=UPI002FE63975